MIVCSVSFKKKLAMQKLSGLCTSQNTSALRNCSRSSGRITTRPKVQWWVSPYLIILLITAGIISVWAVWKRWTLKSHRSSRIWLQTFIDGEEEGLGRKRGERIKAQPHSAPLPPYSCQGWENSHRERCQTMEFRSPLIIALFLLNAVFCLQN